MTNGFNDEELSISDATLIERLWANGLVECDEAIDRIEQLVATNKELTKELAEANARADNYEGLYTMVLGRATLQPAPTVTTGWPTEEGEGSIIVGNVKGDSHD